MEKDNLFSPENFSDFFGFNKEEQDIIDVEFEEKDKPSKETSKPKPLKLIEEIGDHYELFEGYGLQCFVNKSHVDVWTGFVGIPKDHPLYGKKREDRCKELNFFVKQIRENEIDQDSFDEFMNLPRFFALMLGEGLKPTPSLALTVHGGVSFAGKITMNDLCNCIRRFPENLWWFGFHCGQPDDIVPNMKKETELFASKRGKDGKMKSFPLFPSKSYKDKGFALFETRRLAYQLSIVYDKAARAE